MDINGIEARLQKALINVRKAQENFDRQAARLAIAERKFVELQTKLKRHKPKPGPSSI